MGMDAVRSDREFWRLLVLWLAGALRNRSTQHTAREDILAFLATGGRPALRELAQASGMTEQQFLNGFIYGRPSSRPNHFRDGSGEGIRFRI